MNGLTKLLISAGIIGLAASYMATKMDPGKSGAPARAAETTRPAEPVRSAALTQAQRPPDQSRATGGRVEIAADSMGQFSAQVEIDGRRLKMLVDTGATFISLSHEDAASLGLRLPPSAYTTPLATANGELRAARTTLRNVRVNGITAYDVQAIVLPRGASSVSLLGMSFLSKLGGFEVARGNLILKP